MPALSELTLPEAIRKAVDEFKVLGREKFLAKHGHSPSVRYFAFVDDVYIDSKPLLSVAYGYQYPGRGPLSPYDFSGGNETRRALARFGIPLVENPATGSAAAQVTPSSAVRIVPTQHYGEVPGYPPGSVFKNRREAFDSGIHRQLQAGIAGRASGTQSICMSDGYSDDDLQGDLITYTGFGGRDPNTGRHVADQKLIQGNLGLVENYALGRPVRVLVKESVLTGRSGDSDYVYLGLFSVIGWAWGKRDGFKILVYQLRAVAGESLVPGEVAASLARGEDIPTARREATVNRIVRNYALAASIKRLYDHTCQVCRTRLETAAGPYSEAAHIRPLGIPHNGPDTLDNLLCLCPNCHVLFDGHALTVSRQGTVLRLGVPEGELLIKDEHEISLMHLAYHFETSQAASKLAPALGWEGRNDYHK